MHLNETGSGTYPMKPIELPWNMPIPNGCSCKWDFHIESRTKVLKFLDYGCKILDHRIAFEESHLNTPTIVEFAGPKKERGQRGKDRNIRRKSALISHRETENA